MKPYVAQNGKPIFNDGISPIGLICHLYHDRPQLKTKDKFGREPDIDSETGFQKAEYKVTLAWSKTRENELMDIMNLAYKTQEEAWPGSTAPGAFFALEPFFRDGDNPAHNTEGRDYLKGRYYLNFKKKAKAARDPNTGQVLYTGAPGLLGPYGPEDKIMFQDLWPGCTGRVSFTMFGSEYMGKHFISVRMQNLQKYDEGDGTRIGGGGSTPDPSKQFGSLMPGNATSPALGGLGMGPITNAVQNALGNAFGGQPQTANPFGGALGGTNPAHAQNPFAAPSHSNPFGGSQQQRRIM